MSGQTKVKAPAPGAAGAGAIDQFRRGATEDQYTDQAMTASQFDIDSDTPQAVVAYVSRSNIYVIDQNLNVVAFGRLTRREVLA